MRILLCLVIKSKDLTIEQCQYNGYVRRGRNFTTKIKKLNASVYNILRHCICDHGIFRK